MSGVPSREKEGHNPSQGSKTRCTANKRKKKGRGRSEVLTTGELLFYYMHFEELIRGDLGGKDIGGSGLERKARRNGRPKEFARNADVNERISACQNRSA